MQTYTAVPTDEVIDRTVETLKSRTNINAAVVEKGVQAIQRYNVIGDCRN